LKRPLFIALLICSACGRRTAGPPIEVGVLHSFTGTMAFNEKPVADATLLAIEELNRQGGVLGRHIQPVVVDGRSDPEIFAREAERLITQEKVSTLFGCWTSACRKGVKAVVEKYDALLFYPLQYEGLEQSPNIVYTGAAPNQQIIPAVKWAFDNLGRRFFLAGSDYVFPRTANSIIKDQVAALGGEIAGEDYVVLGSHDVARVVADIVRTRPSVILNTINGDSNTAFFAALRKAGISPAQIPAMSFSLGESDLESFDPSEVAGDYAAWNYFETLPSAENQRFIAAFHTKYGEQRTLSDPMEAAYFGVHLWAQAVSDAQSDLASDIRKAVGDQSMLAPEGLVYIDRPTQHTWKTVRIGRIRQDRQFDVLWSSEVPVRPAPYPIYRFRSEWDLFLISLYDGWGHQWANAGAR
jgi:urea transport system substrate-binding protein